MKNPLATSGAVPDLGERLDALSALDQLVDPVSRAVHAALPSGPFKDGLHGTWLGHPLHPALTDLPIGFWTSAFVLDIVGGRRSRAASDAMVGLGVLSALPTMAAGAADWSELNKPEQRSGLVHAVANLTATGLYAMSWVARKRGRRGRGFVLAMAGATAATAGGFLGGHLTFRRAAGVNQNARVEGPKEWTVVADAVDVLGGRLVIEVDGEPVLLTRVEGELVALGARCSHLGGPLGEGEIEGSCVTCPWHRSTFDLTNGAVVRGPATAPQRSYEVRSLDDKVEIRARR